MTGLKELQDTFQRAVTEGNDAVLSEILDSSKEKRDVLLGVYRNAYIVRLRDILADDYQKLAAYLGEKQFVDLAQAYIAAEPSRTSNARWFGAKLPEFLRRTSSYREQPVLAELAALERALNDVFDSAEAEVMTLAELAAVPPEQWGGLAFDAHPAVRRLDFTTNADDIWSALNDGDTPPKPETPAEPDRMIVYRPDATAKFRIMPADEAMMWDEAANGATFGVLCEMLATYAGPEEAAQRAAGYLQRWIDAGLLKRTADGMGECLPDGD